MRRQIRRLSSTRPMSQHVWHRPALVIPNSWWIGYLVCMVSVNTKYSMNRSYQRQLLPPDCHVRYARLSLRGMLKPRLKRPNTFLELNEFAVPFETRPRLNSYRVCPGFPQNSTRFSALKQEADSLITCLKRLHRAPSLGLTASTDERLVRVCERRQAIDVDKMKPSKCCGEPVDFGEF